MIKVAVTGEAAVSGAIKSFQQKTTLNNLSRIAAAAGVYVWKEHFRQFYVPRRNKLGGVSTGYWRDVHDSVVASRTNEKVVLTAKGKGLRQKFYGGPVTAKHVSDVTGKRNRFLTIPVHPKAHSKTISDLGGKKKFYIIPTRNGKGAGVYFRAGGRTKGKRKSDPLYYVLKRRVVIRRDLNIIPDTAKILAEMQKRLDAQK